MGASFFAAGGGVGGYFVLWGTATGVYPSSRDVGPVLTESIFPLLEGVDLVCISPGLSLEDEVVRRAVAMGTPVVGDIELFAWENKAPVIAITGTNGKTTVTALVGHLLRTAGVDCQVAGNIAPPVLEAAMKRTPAVFAASEAHVA